MNGTKKFYCFWIRFIVYAATLVLVTSCQNQVDSSTKVSTKVAQEENTNELLEEALRDVSLDDSLDGRLGSFVDPSWGQDKTPVTIDWYVTYEWFKKSYNPEINLGDMKLLEHTGISINLITGSMDELNTMIANGQIPDIITTGTRNITISDMETNGMLYPLNELIDQYSKEANIPQSMIDWYTAEDGNWYKMVSFFSSDERVSEAYGGHEVTHNGNWYREDILEEIDMTVDDMSTKEGFIEALLKVKEAEITYNDELVTPFVLDVWYGAVVVRFAEQFGVDYEDEDGNLVNVYRTPEYLESLLF